MVKYICEVNKDSSNNKLSLVHKDKYNAKGVDSGIAFTDSKEFHKYLHNHCISENKLKTSNNGVYTFLLILFIVFLIYSLIMLFKNNKVSTSTQALPVSSFGKFSF